MPKCFNEVSDFEEKVRDGELNILFLYDDDFPRTEKTKDNGPKHPIGGKYNYVSLSDVYSSEYNQQRNLGIGLPKELPEGQDKYLCIIDVDGDDTHVSNDSEKVECKRGTRLFFFELLKKGFEKRGIKPMYISTANHGFHIYIYITQTSNTSHGFKNFEYPRLTMNDSISTSSSISEYPIIRNIAGQRVENKALEIFTRGAYVVAPGSQINGVKYELLSEGAQAFSEISTYDEKNIEDLVREILEDNGFVYNAPVVLANENTIYSTQNTHDLKELNVQKIGDLVLELWPLIDGSKQIATLSLGGFLYHMGVSESSLIDIGNYVVDNAPQGLFKGSPEHERTVGFMTALLHDVREQSTDKKTNGLTFLKELFYGKTSMMHLTKTLWLNSRPYSHEFYPSGSDARRYSKVCIDFGNHLITQYSMVQGKYDKETDSYGSPVVDSQRIIFHSLDDFLYIDDISSPPEPNVVYKPISFVATNELGVPKKYIFDNTDEMFNKYGSIPGAHDKNTDITLRHIINEYERIDLIGEIESSKNPGIYLSRDQTKLRRFIKTADGIVEEEPKCPEKDDLISALKLLKKINNVFPWHEDKFATFIKLGLILPYSYLIKQNYGHFIRGILLYGEAGTLKSTAGDLIEYMHVPEECILLDKKWYIASGSDWATEYRIGRGLDLHSYPTVVNEVEAMFSNVDNRELIKNAIDDVATREPGNDKRYFARSNPILTANNLPDVVETSNISRRFLVLKFTMSERGDTKEVLDSLAFLNVDGKVNARFTELKTIGDFIYYILSENISFFWKNTQDLCDAVISEMASYSGENLDWLLQPSFESYTQYEREDEVQNELEMVITVLREPFLRANRIVGFNGGPSEQSLNNYVKNEASCVFRIDSAKYNGVLITQSIKKEIQKKYPDYPKTINLDRLSELFNYGLTLSEETTKKRLKVNNTSRKRGVFMQWIDFCAIFGINLEED